MDGEHEPPLRELRRDFGVDGSACDHCTVGFESDGWIIDSRWFVKVWHDHDHPVDLTLPGALADVGLPVPRPLRASPTRTDDGRLYAVFPYVHGRHATEADAIEVARLLRRVHDVPTEHLPLVATSQPDQLVDQLRPRLSHPWIAARAGELNEWLDRFEEVLARARSTQVPVVLSHDDLDGTNVLIGDDGQVVAALDWDWARLGPREHDLWTVIDHTHPRRFLEAYGIDELDLNTTHLEVGLIRRALSDLAARVVQQVDRPGITTWGFERLARIDDTLALFR